jgi:outer membrane lipoprotein-sorting protein|tara:strand:+ start:176 stop:730 length:555 start_codon:yes stop_codon:yes gene_type:complete
LFVKFLIVLFVFYNFTLEIRANEKQLIINQLINIDNITFDFEQTTNEKKEIGVCILVFDNKLLCKYKDSIQKEILINGKTLIVRKKRYDKIYFYPFKNSPLSKIFNKNDLINLIKESDYNLKRNIELTYLYKNNNKVIIYFEKDSYNFLGWKTIDQLQNEVNFSIKITNLNSEIDSKIFKIPSP